MQSWQCSDHTYLEIEAHQGHHSLVLSTFATLMLPLGPPHPTAFRALSLAVCTASDVLADQPVSFCPPNVANFCKLRYIMSC